MEEEYVGVYVDLLCWRK